MIWSIQYLRFFACLLVVFYHITFKISLTDGGGYLKFGSAGVDIFFIISGFIMVFISRKKESDWLSFLENRFLRIYPIYLITLMPFIAIFLIHPEMVNSHTSPPSIIKSISLLPFFNGSYVNLVAWTLSYELYFYILFSISLMLKWKPTIISSLLISVCFFIGKYFNVGFLSSDIVFEFVIGMMVFELLNKRNMWWGACLSLIVIGVLMLISTNHVDVEGDFKRLFFYGIPSTIIFIGFLKLPKSWREFKLLSILGNASYSIYLTHIISINIVYSISKRFNVIDNNKMTVSFLSVIFAVTVGYLVFKYIETPTIKLSKSFFIKKGSPTNT